MRIIRTIYQYQDKSCQQSTVFGTPRISRFTVMLELHINPKLFTLVFKLETLIKIELSNNNIFIDEWKLAYQRRDILIS